MSKKTIFVLSALILGFGISQKFAWGQNDSSDNSDSSSSSSGGNSSGQMSPKSADIMAKQQRASDCHKQKVDHDKCEKKIKSDCQKLDDKDGTHNLASADTNGNFTACEKAATDCDRAITDQMNKTQKDLWAQLHPTKSDGDDTDGNDDGATNTPPPLPGDPQYCDPSYKADDDDAGDASKLKATKSSKQDPPPKDTNLGCETMSAQNKIDLLDNNLNSDNSASKKSQKDFETAETNLSNQSNSCYGQMKSAQDALAKAQLDLQSSQKEEMTEIGGLNTQLTQKLDDLRNKIDQANTQLTQIAGPDATTALNNYSMATNKALADCRQNLVLLGRANQLKFGDLSSALGASSVGLTASKCQTDFAYQQAKATAWMVFMQAQQQNQVKYMAVQTDIANLNRQISNANYGAQVANSGLVTKYANRASMDQLTIKQANDDLTQAQGTCAKTMDASQRTSNQAMGTANKAVEDARIQYCQEEDLKKKYNLPGPDGKTDSDVKDYEHDHKDLITDQCVADPCAKNSDSTLVDSYCTDFCAPPTASPPTPPAVAPRTQ